MEKQNIKVLYSILVLICFWGFFCGLGSYSLLDIDETRYVDMSREMFRTKEFLTLYLNGEFFFEKPPLYFWIECLSFKLTGVVSELSARLPVVLLSLMPVLFLIFLCRKANSDKFAIITTATLFTSLEYIILTKIAILDSVLTSFVSSSVLCYFATFFVEEKNKKYFWALTYIFSALAVLAKGIPGVAIPALVIAVSTIIFKTYKETLKYSFGILLFLIICLPWHLIMIKIHGSLFFEEYIIKHHILRFLGAEVIHRSQPWYFIALTLLWGLFPHIFIFLSQIFEIKNIKFNIQERYSKFLVLNAVAAIIILLFFSLSGAKLITYILPIYPFTAVIIGAIWLKYINSWDRISDIAVILMNSFLSFIIICLFLTKIFMPPEIYINFQRVQLVSLLIFIPFVCLNWIFWFKKKRLNIFLSTAIFMSVLSGFLTPYVYEFIYSFGQNDLMKFAKTAKENNFTISTYLTGRKYSLLYYGNQPAVDFQTEENSDWLKKELFKKDNILIIRNRDIKKLPVRAVEKGNKYSIVERIRDEK